MEKMKNLNVPDWIVGFCAAFLRGCTQHVCFGGNFRLQSVKVVSGVPQGSVIGPALFCIATSDFSSEPKCGIAKYADDTTIWTCSVAP